MKPVNLLPADSPVVSANAGKPNVAALGGAAFGFIALVAVAGYFAMARVDSVKDETALITARATEATNETAAVNSQVASLGQPVVDSDKELARGQEAVLVSAYTERHDFPELAAELQGIMEGTGGWYETITASAAGADSSDAGGKAVMITAIMPTEQLAAAFGERASATRTLKDAEIVSLESTTLTDLDSKRNAVYWRLTLAADLVDTVAPTADGAGGGADGTGTVVGNGGGTGELTLSLDSKPKPKVDKAKAAAPAAPAKPKNPFDVAADAAVKGAGA